MLIGEKNLYGDRTAHRAHIVAAERAAIYVMFKHLQRIRRNAIASLCGAFAYIVIMFLFCGVM